MSCCFLNSFRDGSSSSSLGSPFQCQGLFQCLQFHAVHSRLSMSPPCEPSQDFLTTLLFLTCRNLGLIFVFFLTWIRYSSVHLPGEDENSISLFCMLIYFFFWAIPWSFIAELHIVSLSFVKHKYSIPSFLCSLPLNVCLGTTQWNSPCLTASCSCILL